MPRPHKPYFHPVRKRWRVRVAGEDRWLDPALGPRDEAAAWAAMHQLLRPAASAAPAPAPVDDAARAIPAPTLNDLRQLYLRWAEDESRTPGGAMGPGQYRVHRSRLKRLVRMIGADRPAASIAPEDLEAMVRACRAEGRKPGYVDGLCASAQALCNWAARTPRAGGRPGTLLEANPIAGHRPPPLPESPDRYLDRATARKFTRWAWARARRQRKAIDRRFDRLFLWMLRFIASTGCRPKEACRARWADVNWRERTVVLAEWKNGASTGRLRRIELTADVVRIVRAIERLPGRHPEWIFTHARGTAWGARSRADGHVGTHGDPWADAGPMGAKLRVLRGEAHEAGVPIAKEGPARFVLYLFRHAYVTDGLHAGAALTDLAELTGTSPEMIVRHYGHLQRDHLRTRAEQIAALRRQQGKGPGRPGG